VYVWGTYVLGKRALLSNMSTRPNFSVVVGHFLGHFSRPLYIVLWCASCTEQYTD
jgi:hypothetical protein